ncbi:MAG: hypothetical protein IJT16_10425, partial [Lachnospiraceae bacterium]|nr:hypothetical protein [Lachnospiraceae bacterium]
MGKNEQKPLTGEERTGSAQRLLLCKNTGAYCALACPSGYFEMEYGNDTGGPLVIGIFDPLSGGLFVYSDIE